jgi:hypothetical protein
MLGTVLLSTLVASGIHGLRIHQRQMRFNEHRIEAVDVAERLFTLWSNQPGGVPIGSVGVIDSERHWFWRTQLIGSQTVFDQPVWVVRFEIFENHPIPNTVLVSVEFLQSPPASTPPISGPSSIPESEAPEPTEPPT